MPSTVPVSVIDGTPGYGSKVITFSNAGAFLAENITPSRPVQTARDRTTNGAPQNSRYTRDFESFTAVLQAPATFGGWPQFGERATVTLDDNYGPEIWILMPPEVPLSNDPSTLRKINITMHKQNTSTFSTSTATSS